MVLWWNEKENWNGIGSLKRLIFGLGNKKAVSGLFPIQIEQLTVDWINICWGQRKYRNIIYDKYFYIYIEIFVKKMYWYIEYSLRMNKMFVEIRKIIKSLSGPPSLLPPRLSLLAPIGPKQSLFLFTKYVCMYLLSSSSFSQNMLADASLCNYSLLTGKRQI